MNRQYIDLRLERELRGISIEAMSKATKIPIPQLQALEVHDFDSLPGGPILKGYIRSYWNHLGLDPEMLPLELKWLDWKLELNQLTESKERFRHFRYAPLYGFLTVLAGLLVLIAFTEKKPSESTQSPATQLETDIISPMAWDNVKTTLENWSEENLSLDHPDYREFLKVRFESEFKLTATAKGPTWVRLTYITDGRAVLDCMFPQQQKVIPIEDEMVLEIGDPESIALDWGTYQGEKPDDLPNALHFIPAG